MNTNHTSVKRSTHGGAAAAILVTLAGYTAMTLAAPSTLKVTAAITKQYEAVVEDGLSVVELVTIVPPPNRLTQSGLKAPTGVTLASAKQDDTGCATGGSECRQRFSLNLDTHRNGCSLTGEYALELLVVCRPGAPATQCQPGTVSIPFKLAGSSAANPGGACSQRVVNQKANLAQSWRQLPGTASDIGMGGGTLWMIGSGAATGDQSVYRWDGKAWIDMKGKAVRLDVTPEGYAWVVNDKGEIWRHDGRAWNRVPGIAKDIGIGANGAVWVIGAGATAGGFEIFRWNNGNWQKMPGGGTRIDVDPQGNAWVVSDGGDVFRYTGSNWAGVPGVKARDIGIGGDGSIFVVGQDGSVHKWNGNAWVRRDGKLAEITVDAQGIPFGSGDNKQIWMGYP